MTDEAMSPLRRRMIEDMTIRKLAPKTQQGYIRIIKDFAAFLGRSPDTASFEDVRRFQLHLAANGAHIPIVNHAVAALRFFFRCRRSRAAARQPLAVMSRAARTALIPPLPTTPAATGTARSAREPPRSNGLPTARPSCCRCRTITWCSRSLQPSPTSPTRTRPSSTTCCSRSRPRPY